MCGYLPTLVLLVLALPGSTDVKASVALLEARYRAAKTLQASFLERYTDNVRVVRVEAGTAYFRRPGKMRWDYQVPEKNLFLVDGKTAWFYVPADHTATRVPAKESSDWRTPLALLAGEMKVSRVCEQVLSAIHEKPEIPEHAMLQCELRGSQSKSRNGGTTELLPSTPVGGESVFFEIDTKSGDLVRILIREPGGIGIEFRFANWRMDPPLSDSLFRFDPPEGVAIVNGPLPSGDTSVNR